MAERAKANTAASAADRAAPAAAGTGKKAAKSPIKSDATKSDATKSGATKSGAAKGTTTTKSASKSKSTSKTSVTKTSATKTSRAAKSASASTTAKKTGTTKSSAARTKGEDTSMAKSADTKTTNSRGGAKPKAATAAAAPEKPKKGRTAAETERIRAALDGRRVELHEEYDQHLVEITELQRDRLTDSAGDDQADTGSKTFEREQEISLANSILERIKQVERALERLDEGSYGWCERCGDAIPVERLAAFPSATLCVRCKQLEERR